jgi:ABC-2 type transport system permease protein
LDAAQDPAGRAGRAGPRTAPWLDGLRAVAGRELAAAFDSNVAYVATIAGLLAVASAFMNEFFLSGKLDMTPFFDALAPALVLLMPAIAMRTWSEDLATRTFELWATLPLSSAQVVLGKYLAALALHLVFLAGTLPIVAMLCALGDPDLGRIASGYLGAVLLGALLLAIGQLVSGLSADQIVVFLATAFAGFALLGCGHPRVVAVLDGWLAGLGTALHDRLSALPHYARFVRGTVAASSLAYFAGLSAVCLALNARAVRTLRT